MTTNKAVEDFAEEMIAPYSVHRKKYARPHGTVARRELKNRIVKRLSDLLIAERISENEGWLEHFFLEAVPKTDIKRRITALKSKSKGSL